MRQKGFAPLMILIAFVIVAGIAFIIGQNFKDKSAIDNSGYVPPASAIPSLLPSDWKTYKTAEYSFSYPEDFEQSPYSEPFGKGVSIVGYGPVQKASGRTQTSLFDGLLIKTVEIVNSGKTVAEISEQHRASDLSSIDNSTEGQEVSAPGQENIDGRESTYYLVNTNMATAKVVFIPYGNSILKISIYYAGEASAIENYKSLGDQILSTFKFINPTATCFPRPACLNENPACSYKVPDGVVMCDN